jgi:hypothetical protein
MRRAASLADARVRRRVEIEEAYDARREIPRLVVDEYTT